MSARRPRKRPPLWLLPLGAAVLAVHLWLVERWLQRTAPPVGSTAPQAVTTRSTPASPAPAASAGAARVQAPPLPPAEAADRLAHAASAPASASAPPAKGGERRAVKAPRTAASAAPKAASADGQTQAHARAPDPAGGATDAASVPAPATCPAVQADQLPHPVRARYRLSRGPLHGDGWIEWRAQAQSYQLRLEGRLPLVGALLEQRSEGGFDACGVAPLRHTERRLKRSERALTFRRQAGEVMFSAQSGTAPLEPGMQDRLSWLVQLAGLLNARQDSRAPLAAGMQFGIAVAAVGGDVQHWHFTLVDRARDGTWHLRREADDPYDTHAEVWCDPARQHWPVRVELREARGDPLRLELSEFKPLP